MAKHLQLQSELGVYVSLPDPWHIIPDLLLQNLCFDPVSQVLRSGSGWCAHEVGEGQNHQVGNLVEDRVAAVSPAVSDWKRSQCMACRTLLDDPIQYPDVSYWFPQKFARVESAALRDALGVHCSDFFEGNRHTHRCTCGRLLQGFVAWHAVERHGKTWRDWM